MIPVDCLDIHRYPAEGKKRSNTRKEVACEDWKEGIGKFEDLVWVLDWLNQDQEEVEHDNSYPEEGECWDEKGGKGEKEKEKKEEEGEEQEEVADW